MREDISDPSKLAVKDDEIWQSSSARSVNIVSAISLSPNDLDDSVNALHQCPQPRPAPCLAPCPPPHASHPPALSFSSTSNFAGIIANTVIRLNIAELSVLGFRETS